MNKLIERIIQRLHDEIDLNPVYDYEKGHNGAMHDAINIIEEETKAYNSGWIPADNPPKDGNYVLLSFSNFSVLVVGRYEEDENGGAYYVGDEDETLSSQGIFVNAWMPLPAPYREDMQQAKQTNGDRIRAMSNEELAMNMMCPNENGLGEIDCNKSDNCNCYECSVKWLKREVE